MEPEGILNRIADDLPYAIDQVGLCDPFENTGIASQLRELQRSLEQITRLVRHEMIQDSKEEQ